MKRHRKQLALTLVLESALIAAAATFLLPPSLQAQTQAQTKGIDPALLGKAKAGDVDIQFSLGLFYDQGQGVPQDYTKAAFWYRKAAEQGDSSAQGKLGLLYYHGHGVPQDYTQASFWYLKAAEQGYAQAQFNLGVLYYQGQGVPQDYTKAAFWYLKAAEQGDAQAQFNLGLLYDRGQGVPQDYTKAAFWYRKAAEPGDFKKQSNQCRLTFGPQKGAPSGLWCPTPGQGEAIAQFNLGVSYHEGRGVSQDDTQAAFWFRKAAEQGFASAQYDLEPVINFA